MGLVQLGADEQANGVDQLRADLNAPIGGGGGPRRRGARGPGHDDARGAGRVLPRPGVSPGAGHRPGSAVQRRCGDRRPVRVQRVRGAVALPGPQHGRDARGLGGAADARGAVRPGRRRHGPDGRAAGLATRPAASSSRRRRPPRPRPSPPSCSRRAGANLGDPLDYGAYLMGWLTGTLAERDGVPGTGLAAAAAGLQPGLGPGLRVPVLGLHAPRVERAAGAAPRRPTWRGPTSGGARRRSRRSSRSSPGGPRRSWRRRSGTCTGTTSRSTSRSATRPRTTRTTGRATTRSSSSRTTTCAAPGSGRRPTAGTAPTSR